MIRTRSAVVGLLFLAGLGCLAATTPLSPAALGSPPIPIDETRALRLASEYLWSQQAADGAWRSDTYGVLKSGQALTPFVLHSLLQTPEGVCPRPAGAVERALGFLRANVNDDGALGLADEDVLEYPNYATAHALRVFLLVGASRDRELITRMTRYLAAQQFGVDDGFTRRDLAYGGWGFGGARSPAEPGHLDLAHTRHALQALAATGATDRARSARAELFLRCLQRHPDDRRPQPLPADFVGQTSSTQTFDGGFYFSPVVLAANKGRFDREAKAPHWRSYASATCDGALALLAAGVARDDQRLLAAKKWLVEHPQLNSPPGVPTDQPEPWGEAIQFYYLATRAEAAQALDLPGDWRREIVRILYQQQRVDGSLQNRRSPLMKEDDPLLATSLAVLALAYCRQKST